MKKYDEKVMTELTKLEHTAFGTFRDPKDGIHYLVRIKYDGPSATVGSISLEKINTSKDSAVSAFKVAVASETDIVG